MNDQNNIINDIVNKEGGGGGGGSLDIKYTANASKRIEQYFRDLRDILKPRKY